MIFKGNTVAGLLIAGAILAYLNSFSGGFQFDDTAVILEDRRLESLGAFVGRADEMIRPLVKLTFLIDRHLYGEDPAGYHLLNLLLHCGSGLLLFAILSGANRASDKEAESSRPLFSAVPLLTALFFLIHPIQTETVTYISGRPTGMSAFFCLLALYLFLQSAGPRMDGKISAVRYAAALISFILALAAKEVALILPCLLLLWQVMMRWLPLEKSGSGWRSRECMHDLRKHAPFWVVLLLALAGAWWHPRYGLLARASLEARPVYDNLLTQLNAISHALSLYFLPARLNFDHDLPIFHSAAQWPIPICFVLLGGLLVAAVWAVPKLPLFSLGIFWFFLCILPANSVIPRYDILSERNLYLASAGVILAVVTLSVHVTRRLAARWRVLAPATVLALYVLITAGLMSATVSRNRVYSNEVSFWSDAARKSPLKPRPHNNLGYALFRTGEVDQAMEEFRTALSLDPGNSSARNNLLRAWMIKQHSKAGAFSR